VGGGSVGGGGGGSERGGAVEAGGGMTGEKRGIGGIKLRVDVFWRLLRRSDRIRGAICRIEALEQLRGIACLPDLSIVWLIGENRVIHRHRAIEVALIKL